MQQSSVVQLRALVATMKRARGPDFPDVPGVEEVEVVEEAEEAERSASPLSGQPVTLAAVAAGAGEPEDEEGDSEDEGGGGGGGGGGGAAAAAAPVMGVADRQSVILDLLKERSSESFTAEELEQLTGLPILCSTELLQSLARNECVSFDGERYRARFRHEARNRAELVDLITRDGADPLRWRELVELYPEAEADLCDLTRRAELVRIKSDDMQCSDVVLARAQVLASLVRVSGRVEVRAGECMVRSDRDLRMELFRNDVVWIGEPGAAGDGSSSSSSSGGGGGGGGARVFRVSSRSVSRTGSGAVDPEFASTGVHRPSVQNFNRAHGAAYSAADTLPHGLHHSRGYAYPFTATHFPLDRAWDGPSAKGLALYRMGCTGDARVLWREIVHHKVAYKPREEGGGAVGLDEDEEWGELEEEEEEAEEKGEGAGAGAGAGGGSSSSSSAFSATTAAAAAAVAAEGQAVWNEAGVYANMGGLNAFLGLPAFPDTHRALRREMEKVNMITRCAPGVLDVEMGLPMVAPMTEAERARLRKSRGPRALDSRMTELDASTIANLNEETKAKLKASNEAILRKRLEAKHMTHGDEFKGMAGGWGGR